MIRYVIAALCGVITTGIGAGLPMYTRFVAMETTMARLAISVDKMTEQVQALNIEVTELRVQDIARTKGYYVNYGPQKD